MTRLEDACRFDHQTRGQRVVFGAGGAALRLSDELTRLGARSPFVVAADRHLPLIRAAGLAEATRHADVVEHVPVEVAERARSSAAESGADVLVCVGGGSATGLAKAVALTTGLPIVATPTTFAGSEATDVWGLTDNGRKRTGVDPIALPTTVIYDPELVVTLPPALAVASGLNAVAHCVDAMWGPRADPIDRALAMEGLAALRAGLPMLLTREPGAAATTLYGCYLAGVAFSSAGSGLHHKICHVLGGAFGLPHAAAHAIVLPHVLAFNGPAAPEAAARIAAALGATDASAGLADLRRRLGAPRALRDIGLDRADISRATEEILAAVPPNNPRPVTSDALTALLRAAWAGTEPTKEHRQ